MLLPLYDSNPRNRIPFQYVTVGIIAVCAIVYLWQASLDPQRAQEAVFALGTIPAVVFGERQLPPELLWVPAEATLLTSMFMHGGPMHLIGNMLYLWILGDNVEDAMGHLKFLIFYLLCGLAAVMAHMLIDTSSTVPLVGASGELSDYHALLDKLKGLAQANANCDDGFEHGPAEIYSYLRAVLYQRRNKFDPLWNSLVVGGFKDGAPFLGSVDLRGTAYEDDVIATGYGSHLALPIMRAKWTPDLDEGEARALLEDCLRVLFYRDCRALDTVVLSKATASGTLVSDPYKLETDWTSASFVEPKAGQDGDGGW